MPSWREVIGHEGYYVAELTLRASDAGGMKRPITSGYRATWTWERESRPLIGPIDLVADANVRPGGSALIRVRPMLTRAWQGIAAGDVLLLQHRGREVGVAWILEEHDVPEDAPLRHDVIEAELRRRGGAVLRGLSR